MHKTVKYPAAAAVLFFIFTGFAGAQSVYVKGINTITMRTGPGIDHKIIKMLDTGTQLETLEERDNWTKAATPDGVTGWVLTHLTTRQKPDTLVLNEVRKENQALLKELGKLKKENKKLSENQKKLAGIKDAYARLKKKSGAFLDMEKKYDELVLDSQKQKQKIETLKEKLNDKKLMWFLAGAGVLIFGILIGMSAKRNRRSSLL